MANVIKTVLTYPLDGSNRDFNIPFEYLARKFVVVTLIGVDRKVLTINTDYRFATRTTISLIKAWGPADGYNLIELRRVTSTTDRLVDFTDGSILRAYDLNVAQIQTMHVAEEARDLTADTIGVNNDGHLDARGRRIVNVADGIEPGDAITLGQVTRWNDSALNSKNAAKVSETNAKDSENKAKASETNAKNSENLARDWAQKSEDSPVAGSEYSSYHYSRKASASANASASSAAASLASQKAAKVSEDNAKVSETNAKASEVSAKADADRAEREADKLGNMNDLAEAIETVQDGSVFWKNHVRTKSGNVFAERWSDVDPAFGEYYASSSLVSTYRISGLERLTTALYTEGNWGRGDTERGTIAILRRNGGNELTGGAYFHFYPNGSFYSNTHSAMGWQGGWADVAREPHRAPFRVNDVVNNNGGFVPAVTCYSMSTGGYPLRYTTGIISNGTDRWPEAVVARMEGDNNYSATYQCQMGGGIYAWMTSSDGTVRAISFAVEPQSDARLKTVHGKLNTKLPLSNIESMNFVEFTFNSDKKSTMRRGVIAQELQKIDPEYVHNRVYKVGGGEEMEILQLDLTPMTLDALAAIQELSNQVKELKAELKQIKGY